VKERLLKLLVGGDEAFGNGSVSECTWFLFAFVVTDSLDSFIFLCRKWNISIYEKYTIRISYSICNNKRRKISNLPMRYLYGRKNDNHFLNQKIFLFQRQFQIKINNLILFTKQTCILVFQFVSY